MRGCVRLLPPAPPVQDLVLMLHPYSCQASFGVVLRGVLHDAVHPSLMLQHFPARPCPVTHLQHICCDADTRFLHLQC